MNGLIPIEFGEQRILLTSQIAEMYGATTDVISKNFNRNFERYQPDSDYYCLEGEAKRDFLNRGQFDDGYKKASKLYLWTEHGALLHAKSLGTDRAWEVYGELVDTYFRAKEQAQFGYENLSPELQMFKQIFDSVARTQLQQQEQAKAITDMNRRLENTCQIIALNPNAWREEARQLIVRVARKLGGNEYIRDVNAEVFKLVDQRGGFSLETRLTNMRRRMAEEGVCKSKRDKLNKVDVVAEDKRAIEIYIAIVKEMAVKHGVTCPEQEEAD